MSTVSSTFCAYPPCHGHGDGNPLFKAVVKHKVIPLRESFLGEIETPEAIGGVGQAALVSIVVDAVL
jgi:hypothetical protein